MQSPAGRRNPQARETHQGRLRRFDEAIAQFVDGNFNCHFLKVCYGAQVVSTSTSHGISHMRTHYSALSQLSLKVRRGLGDCNWNVGLADLGCKDVGLRNAGPWGCGTQRHRDVGNGDVRLTDTGMRGDSRTCSSTL